MPDAQWSPDEMISLDEIDLDGGNSKRSTHAYNKSKVQHITTPF